MIDWHVLAALCLIGGAVLTIAGFALGLGERR